MREVKAEQGSDEWLAARVGCPSGSGFSKLITSTGQVSKSRDTYINQLVAERFTNEPTQIFETEWMARGRELEVDARAFYEFEKDCHVKETGFLKHEVYECGVSPDGLVGDDGGLEIKCPAPPNHVKYVRTGKLPTEYKAQVQGCLWITGRKWWDFLSYHPSLPPLLIRIERDEAFIEALEKIVIDACIEIDNECKKMEKLL